MTRPPLMSAGKKTLVVVSILRGEVTMADAARREGVSQTSIAKWRDRFLAGGQAALSAGSHGTLMARTEIPQGCSSKFWTGPGSLETVLLESSRVGRTVLTVLV
ncbi:MAG: helix-turn-helix domain-containing protein, partial [Actinomycetota bacterium]|nr:helix-turn-helix domain-containing protein [Actinomycetota bacterium]